MPFPPRKTLVAASSFCTWLIAVGIGSSFLWGYQSRAGAPTDAARSWPAESTLALSADRPTLVMFAHPRCPCTRASIGELDELMAWCTDRVDATVAFYTPEDAEPEFERTDLWTSAARIPGVRVQRDGAGREAQRFGAKTSGHVLLFSAHGELLFSGGITAARGHSGDNAGRAAIAALVSGERMERVDAPVFGCSLLARGDDTADSRSP